MARAWMERKLSVEAYGNLTYGVEVTDVDIPREEGETLAHHQSRMHLRAYREILAFQVFHNAITRKQAANDLTRYKQFYGLD